MKILLLILFLIISCKTTTENLCWQTTTILKDTRDNQYKTDVENFIDYALEDYQKKSVKISYSSNFIYITYLIKTN